MYVIEKFLRDHPTFEPFQPRDLRRTWKTLAGMAGIDRETRDRLQNHSRSDVGSRHYDRWAYLPDKQAAMKTWEDFLQKVVDGEPVEEPAEVRMEMETIEVPDWMWGDWKPPVVK